MFSCFFFFFSCFNNGVSDNVRCSHITCLFQRLSRFVRLKLKSRNILCRFVEFTTPYFRGHVHLHAVKMSIFSSQDFFMRPHLVIQTGSKQNHVFAVKYLTGKFCSHHIFTDIFVIHRDIPWVSCYFSNSMLACNVGWTVTVHFPHKMVLKTFKGLARLVGCREDGTFYIYQPYSIGFGFKLKLTKKLKKWHQNYLSSFNGSQVTAF